MNDRRAFALRELLICIVVIFLLAVLLLFVRPAIQATREAARVRECATKLVNLAKACLIYETRKGELPGYDNALAGKHASWAVVILPLIERSDIYRKWTDPAGGTPTAFLEIYVCDSDRPDTETGAPMSYVANCGRVDQGDPLQDNPANGVFLNCFGGKAALTSDGIVDGAAVTAMLSENVQAGIWAAKDEPDTEMTLGFVWHDQPNADRRINGNRGTLGDRALSFDAARPSSRHTGGVNVVFCQSNVRFISDSIDYKVYQQLMTSDSAKSDLPDAVKAYRLDEKELQ